MRSVRRLILALVAFGAVGLALELVLLDHYLEPAQWAPLVALALTVVATALVAFGPSANAVRAYRGLMVVLVLVGLVGIGFHVDSNYAFEREIAPGDSFPRRVVNTLRGAVPALAPGAVVQLGLLGLIYCWRHPRLDASVPPGSSGSSRPSTASLDRISSEETLP